MTSVYTVSRIFGAFQRIQLDGYSSKSRSDGSLTSCTYGRIFFCNLRKLIFSMLPMLNAALSTFFFHPPFRTHLFHLQPLLPFSRLTFQNGQPPPQKKNQSSRSLGFPRRQTVLCQIRERSSQIQDLQTHERQWRHPRYLFPKSPEEKKD